MPENKRRIIRFADIVLDTGLRTATRGGEPLALGKLTFDVLLVLAEAAPNLVTQQELADRVWDGRYVTHETIAQRIKILRRDLRDKASDPQYLVVVRGQGWRLLPDVEIVDEAQVSGTVDGAAARSSRPDAVPASGFSRRDLVGATGILGISAAAIALAPRYLLERPGTDFATGLQRPLTTGTELALDPALSPDGQWVAYAQGRLGATKIYVRSLQRDEKWELTAGIPGEHRWPRWSRDSQSIAFRTAVTGDDHYIRVIGYRGGPYQDVAYDRHLNGHDWSPVSDEIVYADTDTESIWVCSPERDERRRVAELFSPHAPAWSRNGKEILVASGNYFGIFGLVQFMNVAPSSIWLVSAETGERRQITTGDRTNDSPRWDPDGDGFFFVSNRDGRRAIHHARIPGAGKLVTRAARVGGQDALCFDIAADGKSISYAECVVETNIWKMRIPQGRLLLPGPQHFSQITRGPQQVEGLSVSRDGKWLAYNSDLLFGNQDIFLAALDGSVPEKPLTTDPGTDSMPMISPDQQEVAFQSARVNGIRNLYIYSVTDDVLTQVTASESQDYCPQWSPDGNSLYYFADSTDSWNAWKLTRPNRGARWSEPEKIVEGDGIFVRVSPKSDGPVIYNARVGDPDRGLVAQWPDGRKRLLFPVEGEIWGYSVFSPDGDTVYFKHHDSTGMTPAMKIWAIDVESGRKTELVRMERASAGEFDPIYFDADSENFYFTMTRREAVVRRVDLERRSA